MTADLAFASSVPLHMYFNVHLPDTVPPNRKCVDIFSLPTALILTLAWLVDLSLSAACVKCQRLQHCSTL